MSVFQQWYPNPPAPPAPPGTPIAPIAVGGGYNANPAPRGGQGPYGLVPGPTDLPDPHGDLARLYPGLDAATGQASQNIMSELQGELPPDVISSIQDQAARFGLTSGMPGSDLARRSGAKNIGLTSLGLQQHGLQDYLGLTSGVKTNQVLDPHLQADISANNANLNAAPDPAARAAALEDAFRRGLGAPGAGGAGGGGVGFGSMGGMPNLSASRGSGGGFVDNTPNIPGNFHGTGGGDVGGGAGSPWTPGPAIYPGAEGWGGNYDFGGNAGGSNWQDILDSYGLGGAPDQYGGGDPFAWLDQSGAGGVPFDTGTSPLDDPFAWMGDTGSSGVPYDNSGDYGTGE